VEKDFDGLAGMEVALLIKRKMRRYIALLLSDLEKEIHDEDEFESVRKLVLDYFNDYTRAIWQIIGIEIEGTNYY